MIIRELLVKLGFIVDDTKADEFDAATDSHARHSGEAADQIVAAAERAANAVKRGENESSAAYQARMREQRAAVVAANKAAREIARAERLKAKEARDAARLAIREERVKAQALRQSLRDQEREARKAAQAERALLRQKAQEERKAAQAARALQREQARAERDLLRQSREAAKSLSEMQGQLASKATALANGIKAAFVAAAGSIAGATLAFKDQLDTFREMDKRRASIQATREEYQQLAFVAKESGIDVDNFQESLVTLGQKAFDAFQFGSDAADTLALIGLSATDSNGKLKPTVDLMLEMADAISKMPDGTEKTFILDDIFGDPGAQLIPVMNKGSAGIRQMMDDAQKAGAVFDSALIDRTLAAGKSVSRLTTSLGQVRAALLDKLIPIVQPFVDRLTVWLNTQGNLDRLVWGFVAAIKAVSVVLAGVGLGQFISILQSAQKVVSTMTGASGLMGMVKGLMGLGAAAAGPVAAIAAVVAVIADLVIWSRTGSSLIGGIAESGKNSTGWLGSLSKMLFSIKGGIDKVLDSAAFKSFVETVKTAAGSVLGIISNVLEGVLPLFVPILKIVMTIGGWLLRLGIWVVDLVSKILLTKTTIPLLLWLTEIFSQLGYVVDWLTSLFEGFFSFVNDGIEALANGIGGVVDDIGAIFGGTPSARSSIKQVSRPSRTAPPVTTNMGGVTVNVGGTNATASEIGKAVEGAGQNITWDTALRQTAEDLG